VPLSWSGVVFMIIAVGTIVSSLLCDRLMRHLGTGRVTALSIAMTCAALFGFSLSRSFPPLCLWSVPHGLGAGGVDAVTAAGYGSLFFLGVTAGRAVSSFVTLRLDDARIVRLGQGLIAAGVALLLLPSGNAAALAGLIVIGLGCASVYPSLIHATPAHFGAERSQAVIGAQMANAYVGTSLMPPLFIWLCAHTTIRLFPAYLLVLLILMAASHETLCAKTNEGTNL